MCGYYSFKLCNRNKGRCFRAKETNTSKPYIRGGNVNAGRFVSQFKGWCYNLYLCYYRTHPTSKGKKLGLVIGEKMGL